MSSPTGKATSISVALIEPTTLCALVLSDAEASALVAVVESDTSSTTSVKVVANRLPAGIVLTAPSVLIISVVAAMLPTAATVVGAITLPTVPVVTAPTNWPDAVPADTDATTLVVSGTTEETTAAVVGVPCWVMVATVGVPVTLLQPG